MQQIYKRTPMPKCETNKVALQLDWNRTSTWVFSCKFFVYFQNSFFWEYFWRTVSVCIHGKWSSWDFLIKLREIQIFKTFLRVTDSFKSINFALAKHILVFRPSHPWTGWVNFDWSRELWNNYYLFMYSQLFTCSYLFGSTKTQQFATHLNVHNS